MESWTDFFKAVFHCHTDHWDKTLAIWATMFASQGRSTKEMTGCIAKVVSRNPLPKFPLDILAAMQEELRALDQRAKVSRESLRLEYREPECEYCKDSGWVCGLPHLETVEGPIWNTPRWTQAVTCCCNKGARFNSHYANRDTEPKQILSFLEYTKRNPHYAVQMKQRQLEAESEVAAYEQQHGPHPGRLMLQKVLDRNRRPRLGGDTEAGGLTVDPSNEALPETTADGEILNEMDW